jgi:uncharacterized protein involved in response to NO
MVYFPFASETVPILRSGMEILAPGIDLPSALSVIIPVKLPITASLLSDILFLITLAFENAEKLINSAKKQLNNFNFIIIIFCVNDATFGAAVNWR